RISPATVLLGNSRVEVGLDPESPIVPDPFVPVFNAAEAGRDLFTAGRLLQEAIARGRLKQVVVGLDFPDFLERPDNGPPLSRPLSEDERRLLLTRDGQPNPDRPSQVWRDRIAAT